MAKLINKRTATLPTDATTRLSTAYGTKDFSSKCDHVTAQLTFCSSQKISSSIAHSEEKSRTPLRTHSNRSKGSHKGSPLSPFLYNLYCHDIYNYCLLDNLQDKYRTNSGHRKTLCPGPISGVLALLRHIPRLLIETEMSP